MKTHATSLVLAAVALASAGALAGCASSQPESAVASSGQPVESAAAADPSATIKAFFEAAVNDDAAAMKAAASPGSPAWQYAEFRKVTDTVYDSSKSTVHTTGDEAVLTDSKGTPTTYRDFEFDADGLLVSWSSDPGGPLAPRISTVNTTESFGAAKVTVLQQYKSAAGSFSVAVRVVNPTGQEVNLVPEAYVNPNGRQVAATISQGNSTGVMTVMPKARDVGYISVGKSGKPGGQLVLKAWDTDGYTVAQKTIALS